MNEYRYQCRCGLLIIAESESAIEAKLKRHWRDSFIHQEWVQEC